ncbi:MAG: hypothetical protein M4579_001997 [Chaenotheca gracillima]|nr:MAG: hypothetical protein M4579_001997 [Chaenotheca gracillima]
MSQSKGTSSKSFLGATGQQKSGGSASGTALSNAKKIQRENALKIKQMQEEALSALPERKLYIALWIRDDPPQTSDFHWGFYHHLVDLDGTKYHLRNLGSGWITDHGESRGLFKSQLLCVVIEIGSIPEDKEKLLDQIMRTYDHSANDIPNVTCRVWIFITLQLLVQNGLLKCDDLEALQQECLDFGNHYMRSAASNDQPRPVVVSKLCS